MLASQENNKGGAEISCCLSVLTVCVCSGDGGVTVSCFATLLLLLSEAVLGSPGQRFLSASCLSDFGPGFSSPRATAVQRWW